MFIINKNDLDIADVANQNNYAENVFIKKNKDWKKPNIDKKYRKLKGEDIEEMTTEEKAVVDATELTKAKASKVAEYTANATARLRKKELDDDTTLQAEITSLEGKTISEITNELTKQ